MTGSRAVRSWSVFLGIAAIVVGGVLTLVSIGGSDGDYGSVRVPGSAVLHLPAGRVDLTFTEDTDNQTIDVPVHLDIVITPVAGGAAVPVTQDDDGGTLSINGVSHVGWGSITVPAEGDYKVGIEDEVTPSIPNPKILFGPDTNPAKWVMIGGGIGLVLFVFAFVASRSARRARPAAVPVEPVSGRVEATLYVTGVDGAPPQYLGLGPVRVSGVLRRDPHPRIQVRDHEVTAPTAHWPHVGSTLRVWLEPDGSFVVLWDAPEPA